MVIPDFVIRAKSHRKGLLSSDSYWRIFKSNITKRESEKRERAEISEYLEILEKRLKRRKAFKMPKKTAHVSDQKVRLNKKVMIKKKRIKATRAIRGTRMYLDWRKKILNSFNHTCSFCGAKERLELDHIEPVSKRPDLIMDDSNARILCRPCHQTTDSYPKHLKRTY